MSARDPERDRLVLPAGSIVLKAIEERRSLVVGSLVKLESGQTGRITEFFMMGKEPWYFCRVRVDRRKFDRGVRNVELASAIDRLGDLVVKHERKKRRKRSRSRRNGGRSRRR